MKERITKQHLEFELGRLNANTGNPATPYTWIESDGEPRRLVANEGHFGLETWNGATRLTRDGSRDITPLMTMRELHQVLRGINTVLEECERRPAPGKEAEANLVDIDPGDAAPFEQYLLVTEFVTGRRTAMEISDTEPLDIEPLIERFVATAFGGELKVDNIIPILEGDWHADIITDRRDPDNAVIWSSASFDLLFADKEANNV